MRNFLRTFTADTGATSVEYALLASLVAVVIVGVVTTFGLDVLALVARATELVGAIALR